MKHDNKNGLKLASLHKTALTQCNSNIRLINDIKRNMFHVFAFYVLVLKPVKNEYRSNFTTQKCWDVTFMFS